MGVQESKTPSLIHIPLIYPLVGATESPFASGEHKFNIEVADVNDSPVCVYICCHLVSSLVTGKQSGLHLVV